MCIINAANCVLKHQYTVTRKRHDFVYKSERQLNVSVKLNLFSSVLLEHLCVCVWHFQSAVLWNSIQNTDGLLLCTVVIFSQKLRKYQGWKAIFEKVFISFHICISIYIIVGNFTPVIVNVINTCLQSQQLPHLSMKYKKISNKFFCNERVIIILTGYMKG